MTDYVIINSTDTELTDVNAGGDDVAEYTISADITLTDAELVIVAALNGVAVMQASASAAEKLAVGNTLVNYDAGVAPVDALASVSYRVANGTGGTVGTTAAYKLDLDSLTSTELVALLATDGVLVASAATTDEEKRNAAGVLVNGKIAGHTIT